MTRKPKSHLANGAPNPKWHKWYYENVTRPKKGILSHAERRKQAENPKAILNGKQNPKYARWHYRTCIKKADILA